MPHTDSLLGLSKLSYELYFYVCLHMFRGREKELWVLQLAKKKKSNLLIQKKEIALHSKVQTRSRRPGPNGCCEFDSLKHFKASG